MIYIKTILILILLLCIIRLLNAIDGDGTIYFMFNNHYDYKNHYEHIWTQFFNAYDKTNGMKIRIIRYEGEHTTQYRYGTIDVTLLKLPLLKDDKNDPWNKIYNYINKTIMLLIGTQNIDNIIKSPKDVFIFLPDSSLPLKSLKDIYEHITKKNNDKSGEFISSFCIDPFSTKFNGPSMLSIASKTMILSRNEAERSIKLWTSLDKDYDYDDDIFYHYVGMNWFYFSLTDNINAFANMKNIKSNFDINKYSLDKEICESYFLKNITTIESGHGVHLKKSSQARNRLTHLINTSFILDLHRSQKYFFLEYGRFHLAVIDENNKRHNLVEAVHLLQLYKDIDRSISVSNNDHIGSVTWRRAGDNGGLKVLMVSVDSRQLKPDLQNTDYVTMSSILVSDYAQKNGYDYIKITSNHSKLFENVEKKYNRKSKLGIGDKYGVTIFHPGLGQFRASSWAKMPLLWHAYDQFGEYYDYLWYVDSDLTINPMFNDRYLSSELEKWQNDTHRHVFWGASPKDATFLFFNNFPWREDMPCAGTFLMKSTKLGGEMLREWWDYNLEIKNWYDFMEQDALWYMIENPEYGFLINTTTVSLLVENQFMSEWLGYNDLWLLHIANYVAYRDALLKNMLRLIDLYDPIAYKEAVENIITRHELVVDPFPITDKIESLHGQHRTQWPPDFKGPPDDYWHRASSQSIRPPKPPPGSQFDGLVISLSPGKEIWFVDGGNKRLVPNLETFNALGFDLDLLITLRAKDWADHFPIGDPIPDLNSPNFNNHINATIIRSSYPNMSDYFWETKKRTPKMIPRQEDRVRWNSTA